MFRHPFALLLSLTVVIGLSACESSELTERKPAPANSVAELQPNQPTGPIGSKYFAPGPWAVTAQNTFACCDSTGNAFDIWYPTDLGQDGFKHPIITWGNGSDAVPEQYTYLLNHLASWGFVVIATELTATASGEEITDAARYLMAESANPSSIFFNKLEPDRVGAMGHSQGSGGSMNALIKHPDVIKTAIVIERPPQYFCAPGDCPSTAGIQNGSVFFINGSADVLISPSTQIGPCTLGNMANEQSNQCLYENVPDNVTKLWATLQGPDHNDVQGQPGCPESPGLCANGVYGFLGYPTAWMMDQLQDDALAHGAFVNGTGEIFQDASWANQISNIGP